MKRSMLTGAVLVAGLILSTSIVHSANRATYNGRTGVYFGPGHGLQVEYYSPAGGAYLWYPGNRRVVAGEWRYRKGATICFRYGASTYNPLTRKRGGKWECSPASRQSRFMKYACKGDPFGLGRKGGRIPYVLPRGRFGLAALRAKCGGQP